MGCYSEKEIAKNSVWNYNTILARGKDMLDFLGEMIGTTFSNAEDYVNVLFYSKAFTIE